MRGGSHEHLSCYINWHGWNFVPENILVVEHMAFDWDLRVLDLRVLDRRVLAGVAAGARTVGGRDDLSLFARFRLEGKPRYVPDRKPNGVSLPA